MATKNGKLAMLPYDKQGEIDYASLDFDPDVFERPSDHMEQELELFEIRNLLHVHLAQLPLPGGEGRGESSRPNIFISSNTNVCYDRRDLNVRVAPDLYLAFGVDAEAIRPRRLYLPWEVGKPPDWALEVASRSTRRQDVERKPGIYAQIGVPEFWRFDPTGGRYYGAPLYGGRLAGGEYQAIELTTEPDGILKGYSEVLQLSLCWDDGWPRFYNPTTGTYLEDWRETLTARANAEARAAEANARADAAEAELRRLRERLGEQGG